MKRKRLKTVFASISAALTVTIAAIFCCAFAGNRSDARAEQISGTFTGEAGKVSVTENSEPHAYLGIKNNDYGCKLTFEQSNSSAVYNGFIEPNTSGSTEIISFSVMPSETGKKESLAPVDEITLRVEQEDDSNKYFVVTLNGIIDVFERNGWCGVKAAAAGQTLGGESVPSVSMPAANGYEGSDYIRTGAGNVKSWSFADVNSNIVTIEYDNETGYVTAGTGGYGKYRNVIRRLKHAYTDAIPTREQYGENVSGFINDSVVFGGFDEDARLKLTVSVASLVNNESQADLHVYSVGGKRAMPLIVADVPSLAVQGRDYALPTPVSYESGKPVIMTDGTYEVISPSGATVQSGNVADKDKFTATQTGDYKIVYSRGEASGEITVRALSQAEADSDYPLAFTSYKNKFTQLTYPQNPIELGAETTSGLSLGSFGAKIEALIYLSDGSTLVDTVNLNEQNSVTFADEGDYKVVYKATDYVGRETYTPSVDLKISYTQIGFTGSINSYDAAAIGSDSEYFAPSADDVILFDVRYADLTSDDVTMNISVLKPDASDYEPFDENFLFDRIGEYEIKYAFSYGGVSGEITRTLAVYDSTPPSLTASSLPVGTSYKPNTASDLYNYSLKAKKGVAVTLPYVTAADDAGEQADLSDRLKYYEIAPDGSVTDRTAQYKVNPYGYVFTPDTVGEYVLRFTVEDSAGLIASLNYMLDVRTHWYYMSVNAAKTAVASSEGIIVPPVSVIDFYGQTVENAPVSVKLIDGSGEVADKNASGKKYVGLAPGKYSVQYTLTVSDESADAVTVDFTVTDDTKPAITVSGAVTNAKAGDTVKLAAFSADDNDSIAYTQISVALGDEIINVYDGTFVAYKAGEYRVTVTAEDLSGNEGTFEYTVLVAASDKNEGLAGWAVALICIGAVVVAAGIAVAVLLVVKRRKTRSAPSETASGNGSETPTENETSVDEDAGNNEEK